MSVFSWIQSCVIVCVYRRMLLWVGKLRLLPQGPPEPRLCLGMNQKQKAFQPSWTESLKTPSDACVPKQWVISSGWEERGESTHSIYTLYIQKGQSGEKRERDLFLTTFFPGWPQIHYPPVSALQVLRLQVCTSVYSSDCLYLYQNWESSTGYETLKGRRPIEILVVVGKTATNLWHHLGSNWLPPSHEPTIPLPMGCLHPWPFLWHLSTFVRFQPRVMSSTESSQTPTILLSLAPLLPCILHLVSFDGIMTLG